MTTKLDDGGYDSTHPHRNVDEELRSVEELTELIDIVETVGAASAA